MPRPIRRGLRNLLRWPGHRRYCPVCRSFLERFEPHGIVPRPEARCPECGALERHRLVWLYLRRCTPFFDGTPRRMLHLAPEPALERPLRRVRGLTRITADLASPLAAVRLDLQRLPFADGIFDVIYCSHVLEHVPDDRAGMRELRRVLKGTGWAILQVPVLRDRTDEDPRVTDPEERLRRFGQRDHVRVYGRDYVTRLEHAGFSVTADDFVRRLSEDHRRYYGLDPHEMVYLCHKPAALDPRLIGRLIDRATGARPPTAPGPPETR